MRQQYYWLGFLLLLTIITLTNFWEFGMMILTVFFLAYVTKGSRKIG